MSDLFNASTVRCSGPYTFGNSLRSSSRRGFIRMGLGGFAGLSLPGILRLQAQSPVPTEQDKKSEKTAVIMV
jgi:hypothetical protein